MNMIGWRVRPSQWFSVHPKGAVLAGASELDVLDCVFCLFAIGLEVQFVGPIHAQVIHVAWVADNMAVVTCWPVAIVGKSHYHHVWVQA